MKVNLESAKNEVKEFRQLEDHEDPDIRKLMHYAQVLEGSARHTGVHAAGVIVAQMIAGDEKNAELLPQIQQLMQGAIQDYASIGTQATAILANFPSH